MPRGFLRLFWQPELAVLDQPLANSATSLRPGARRAKPQFSEISSLESVATPSKWESNRVRKSRRSILRARPSLIRSNCGRPAAQRPIEIHFLRSRGCLVAFAAVRRAAFGVGLRFQIAHRTARFFSVGFGSLVSSGMVESDSIRFRFVRSKIMA